MPKVILVNPSNSTTGYSFITPRWLFVIAGATPSDLVGDPVLVDETLEKFNPDLVQAGDIVGIGLNSNNCVPGYRVLRAAKSRGATVVVGGIHPTIFPDEPLEMGADAVVTGNGDVLWSQVVRDALQGRLQRSYAGGRVPGDSLRPARWDLLDPARYLMASIQTVAGCPENCSFCSVWVTDGRRPRQRLTDAIIEEANELYDLGFRYILLADDNFNPATLGRIARETSPQTRRELERVREERLRFFDEYDRRVPKNLFAFTQMTSEVVSDDEYLAAMYHKMRVRTALMGVESFTEEGLKSANKQWNPVGQRMIETIQKVQDRGILVLSSVICGLESDTVETIRTMRRFLVESGSCLAQVCVYNPYPGTKDFHEMMGDRRNRDQPGYVPKHRTQILRERFWLDPGKRAYVVRYANISSEDLLAERQKCWDEFYSFRQIYRRVSQGVARSWPVAGKITYALLNLVYKRVYAEHGISADSVQQKRVGLVTRLLIRACVGVYSHFFRHKKVGFRVERERGASAGAPLVTIAGRGPE